MNKNKHIGSNFDDFLQEEGLLAEAEATAVKRVIAHQIDKEMADGSVTLLTLESVAPALGKKLKVRLT